MTPFSLILQKIFLFLFNFMAFAFPFWPKQAVHCVPQTLVFFFDHYSGPVPPETEGGKWMEKGNADAERSPRAEQFVPGKEIVPGNSGCCCSQHCFGQDQKVPKSFQMKLYNNCVRKRAKWAVSSDGRGAVQDYQIRALVFIDINTPKTVVPLVQQHIMMLFIKTLNFAELSLIWGGSQSKSLCFFWFRSAEEGCHV